MITFSIPVETATYPSRVFPVFATADLVAGRFTDLAFFAPLAAYYTFDADASDSHIFGYDGSANNSGFVAGKVNNAALFDGIDDELFFGNVSFAEPYQPYSFSFWINTTAPINPLDWLFGKYDFATVVGWLVARFQNGIGFGMWSSFGTMYRVSTGVNVRDGAWHHCTCTFDGSNATSGMHVYVDGSLVDGASTGVGVGELLNDKPFIAGHNNGSNYFAGMLDELSIWRYELSLAQIGLLYNAGTGTGYPPPAGIYTDTNLEIVLEPVDSTAPGSVWDMTTFHLGENATVHVSTILPIARGAVHYQYSVSDSPMPTNWNGTWLTFAQLTAEPNPAGRYFRVKVRFEGGQLASSVGDGDIECAVGGDGSIIIPGAQARHRQWAWPHKAWPGRY